MSQLVCASIIRTYLWVVVPDLDCPLEDGGVLRVDPVEEHHVRDLRVEGEGDAAQVARQTDHRLPNLLCTV